MANQELSNELVTEAQPFLRYSPESMKGAVQSADSDSASCGEACECGSGAEGCAHVPEQPKVQM